MNENLFKKRTFAVVASLFALTVTPVAIDRVAGLDTGLITKAMAEEGKGSDGGSGSGGKGKGSSKNGGAGHETEGGGSKSLETKVLDEGTDTGENEGPHGSAGTSDKGKKGDKKMSGSGKGGPSADSDAKGPRHSGGTTTGSKGGKPVWSQEGIPEVELGRLNVARSPAKVIDKATVTALATLQASPALYTLSTLEEVKQAILNSGTTPIIRIDSPLENLGLYKDLLKDGKIVLPNGTTFYSSLSTAELAGIFLGGASDKTVPISNDTVIAVSKILGLTVGDSEVAAIQASAETIRDAINTAHGE
jgi:hypothetical protein